MTSTTAGKPIEIMRFLFLAWELPEMVMSYNGPSFQAEEFKTFLKRNGVKQVFSPSYYAWANG
jgi:transposase InsO family protein